MDKRLVAFSQLLGIMDDLREKCPWDRQQTFESLRHLTIEETYELAEAILDNDWKEINNELGDLMLHIVFYSKIGSELGAFDITSVLETINKKLINRHPHVYGNVEVADAEKVKENWEHIKLKEGKKKVLSGVPRTLPAMIKAYRIQDKARGVGFDWENKDQVWGKVLEEIDELQAEVKHGSDHDRIEEEFGDLMFALINYARFIHVNPENALERTNKKFIRRFEHLELGAKNAGKEINRMNLKEMDEFWNEAKSKE
jgi:XTP/dITP diphosphohydrolase